MKKFVTLFLLFMFLLSIPALQCQWKKVNPAGTTQYFDGTDFLDENNGCVVGYKNINDAALLKTTDGGKTWTKVPFANSYLLAVKMVDKNTIYMVGLSDGNGTFFKSTDGGSTWRKKTLIKADTKQYALLDIKLIENILYVSGEKGSIFKSTDNGETWQPTNTGSQAAIFRKLSFIDKNNGIASANKIGAADKVNTIFKTTDGGNTWLELLSDPNIYIADLAYTNNNGDNNYLYNIYYAGEHTNSEAVVKSTDAGKTWNKIMTGVYDRNLLCSYFINDKFGVVGSYEGAVNMTSDGGKTWHAITTGTMQSIFSIYFINENLGFAGATGGEIWKYERLTNGPQAVFSKEQLDFGKVKINTDTNIELDISNTGEDALKLTAFEFKNDPDSSFSIDNMKEISNTLLKDEFTTLKIKFHPKTGGHDYHAQLIIKSNAANLPEKTIDLIGQTISGVEEIFHANGIKVSVSPNPAKNNFSINYSIFNGQLINLKMYIADLNGKIIKNIFNYNVEPGEYQYLQDISGLSAGKYFILAETKYGIMQIPLVVLK